MSLFRRFSQVFQQKANAVLDKAENPAEALDLSYEKMLESLQKVRRSIADVLTSEKRLEGQQQALAQQRDKLQGQARLALQQGQEDLARTALTRAQVIDTQIAGLGPQIEQLRQQEQQLQLTGEKLRAKVEAFRSQRETMKAQYTAAKASTQAVEGVTGLSEHMADVQLMLDRAQDKITNMQARAAAVGQLADTGALDQLTIGGGDDIDARLNVSIAQTNVDAQLAAMKQQLGIAGGGASGAPALEAAGIVVRISGEDQYRLPASSKGTLDELDSTLLAAVEAGDADAFRNATQRLVDLIHAAGVKLPPDTLDHSDVIVPSTDMTLDDARKLLNPPAPETAPTA